MFFGVFAATVDDVRTMQEDEIDIPLSLERGPRVTFSVVFFCLGGAILQMLG